MTNPTPKGICKKHNVGKLEYAKGLVGSDTIYLCPVCGHIRGRKREFKDHQETDRSKIKQLKLEIAKIREGMEEEKLRTQESLKWSEENPQEIFDRDVESRKRFNEEHKQSI